MVKSRGFVSILIPSATVFFSSACIMILELVAGRLIARQLGSSLYTWTSVIGVVLTGITIGNYIGGRIADRFASGKTLAVLFGISSFACVLVVLMNNAVGEWMLLWYLKWPVRVFIHVALVFLIPSTILGMISPVVAKTALDRGLSTGRTVGDIYAWGAAGSIVGTFLAGFYLIAAMGTIAIIWTVGSALLLIAILYWVRCWALYIWAIIFVLLMTMGMIPGKWATDIGSSAGLRKKPSPSIVYEDETQYCYVVVKRDPQNPDHRVFIQDRLKHSEIILGNIKDLKYEYANIYAAATHLLSGNRSKLTVLGIGGGGFVFPRYIEEVWPGSHIDVAEIDPGVTKAAEQAFGLKADGGINVFTMDARNYVDGLLLKNRRGEKIPRYNFIYGDAINDYSVPYQLVTKEFNEKVKQLLNDDGIYMINLIDTYQSGLFVGSIISTLEQTFPHVYVMTVKAPKWSRLTFVVIASMHKIETENFANESSLKNLDLWILSDSDKDTLKKKSRGVILTDDYAPVENMLAPVASQRAMFELAGRYEDLAKKLKARGKLEECVATYKELAELIPTSSSTSYLEIAHIRQQQGKLNEAAEAFQHVLAGSEGNETEIDAPGIHLSLGALFKGLGKAEESKKHYYKAIDILQRELVVNTKSNKAIFDLGVALIKVGKIDEGIKYLEQAAAGDSPEVESFLALAEAFSLQGKRDVAISRLNDGIEFMSSHGRKSDVEKLQKCKEFIESQK